MSVLGISRYYVSIMCDLLSLPPPLKTITPCSASCVLIQFSLVCRKDTVMVEAVMSDVFKTNNKSTELTWEFQSQCCHFVARPWASCSTSLCPRERLETGHACLPGSGALLPRLCMCVSRSVVSNSLQLHGLQLTRLFYPWNSLGKNPEVGCHSLSNPGTSRIAGRFLTV